MKVFELNGEMSEQDRKVMLIELAATLGLIDYKLDNYNDEFTTLEHPFIGSSEGITVYLENNNMLQEYRTKRTFVETGVLPEGWHWAINVWPYHDMPLEELKRMKELISELLKALPKALLFFDDDSSVDYNVNSINPDTVRNYTVKTNHTDDWRKKFDEYLKG